MYSPRLRKCHHVKLRLRHLGRGNADAEEYRRTHHEPNQPHTHRKGHTENGAILCCHRILSSQIQINSLTAPHEVARTDADSILCKHHEVCHRCQAVPAAALSDPRVDPICSTNHSCSVCASLLPRRSSPRKAQAPPAPASSIRGRLPSALRPPRSTPSIAPTTR